ncbi:MAG: SUMF1/EgtB/PvdO family nonheme iron enzyme [Planctomycetia bacterium]|jgi:formylglycine-generating enzyme required for sulfatase activity
MKRVVLLLMIVALMAGAVQAEKISIDMVTVGNSGNAADTTGYGAVDYVYQIGKFEITAGQYTEFLNAVSGIDTYGLYNTGMLGTYGCGILQAGAFGSYFYSVSADYANRPVNYISWGDAVRFCNWLHNGQPTGPQNASTTEDGAYTLNGATSDSALMAVTRNEGALWWLPSEDEWYKAAYHKNDGVTGNYFDYPTSSDSEPSNDLIAPDPGNNANFNQSGYTIGSPYYATEVGEFENSESPYSTFDQGGNLWEWNETEIYVDLSRGVRGGDWSDSSDYLLASFRYSHNPTYEGDYLMGFRVASVPEPGSIALLLCGLVGLICLRHRK